MKPTISTIYKSLRIRRILKILSSVSLVSLVSFISLVSSISIYRSYLFPSRNDTHSISSPAIIFRTLPPPGIALNSYTTIDLKDKSVCLLTDVRAFVRPKARPLAPPHRSERWL